MAKYNVILITSHFPYLPGEQFLETEIQYFQKYKNIGLTILPSRGSQNIRLIDQSIVVDDSLLININQLENSKLSFVIKSMGSNHFYKEILQNNIFNYRKFKTFIWSAIRYQKYYDFFDSYFLKKPNPENIIVYTYWNNEITYALESLKKKYHYKLISRIHGFDLYMERMPYGYMPFKSQFNVNLDKIYTITGNAINYMKKAYNININLLELSRLGVDDHKIISHPNHNNIMHIASCSNLIGVKRIDKIILAISILARNHPKIDFFWTHIGNGILYEELMKLANDKLKDLSNVKFVFKGNLENQEVYEFYRNNNVDLFINVSESEGVPVSIMEAMSCHIPVVAPNVGGISDMVIDGVNGFLLSNKCEITEIVNALYDIEFFKKKEVRQKSYAFFLERYNAKNNYEQFLNKLLSL